MMNLRKRQRREPEEGQEPEAQLGLQDQYTKEQLQEMGYETNEVQQPPGSENGDKQQSPEGE